MSFKMAREKAGFTQIDAAKALNIPQSTLATWEIGKAMPRASKLSAIAALYKCTVDELLTEEK